jgi:hypothetical protein
MLLNFVIKFDNFTFFHFVEEILLQEGLNTLSYSCGSVIYDTNLSNTDILAKFLVAQEWRSFPPFMETEVSLPCL